VIQSPPPQSSTASGNQLENALATSYAQYNLSTVQSVIPEMLANLSTDQEYFDNIAKLRSLCVSEYNNQLPYFQQQEQQQLEDTGRAGQSSVLIGNIKAQYQLELSDLQTTESTCLASYSSTASSTIEQIGSLTTLLGQLQQKAATNPTDLSDIDPILQNFESIYAQVVAINAVMQSPATLPPQPASSGFFDCNTQAGGFACNGAGVSMNCTALGGGSLSCASTNGQNLSCTNNGGGLSCSAY
jgi:hypothetical protein